jgi:hypothetical protein
MDLMQIDRDRVFYYQPRFVIYKISNTCVTRFIIVILDGCDDGYAMMTLESANFVGT